MATTGEGDDTILRRGGVQVAVQPRPYIHAKAFMADNILTFVGSASYLHPHPTSPLCGHLPSPIVDLS